MFKIGDRVKAIAACDGQNCYIGQTGTVTQVTPGHKLNINVKWDSSDLDYNTWWCEEASLELYEDNPKNKFFREANNHEFRNKVSIDARPF